MRAFVLSLLLSSALCAGEIHVPGDFPNVQSTIDAASPGDTILVHLSTTGPLVIDKPLTIVGDPLLSLFDGWPLFGGNCLAGTWQNPVTLAGSGSGTVILVNVVREASGVFDCFQQPAVIVGGGFSELHILDSKIHAPDSGISGSGFGSPAIDVDVPLLLVVNSDVKGGNDDVDACVSPFSTVPVLGHAGIKNPQGAVVVLDSKVEGGNGGFACFTWPDCHVPSTVLGLGVGGTGVVAQDLFTANSTVAGGDGSTLLVDIGGGNLVACNEYPDGADAEVGQLVPLSGFLEGSSIMPIGAPYDLTYAASGPLAALFVALAPSVPYLTAGAGWAFLDPSSLQSLGLVPVGGPHTLTFSIPFEPLLVGLEPAFQLLDVGPGLSRPVTSLILP